MISHMPIDLYAGISVSDYSGALVWYEKLLGGPPSFVVSDTEAVWELAEHRSIFIEHRPAHAGHALLTVFVDDLDAFVEAAVSRGVGPTKRETYPDGVRKADFQDPDSNTLSFGGAPL
jgi:hypothetical protein